MSPGFYALLYLPPVSGNDSLACLKKELETGSFELPSRCNEQGTGDGKSGPIQFFSFARRDRLLQGDTAEGVVLCTPALPTAEYLKWLLSDSTDDPCPVASLGTDDFVKKCSNQVLRADLLSPNLPPTRNGEWQSVLTDQLWEAGSFAAEVNPAKHYQFSWIRKKQKPVGAIFSFGLTVTVSQASIGQKIIFMASLCHMRSLVTSNLDDPSITRKNQPLNLTSSPDGGEDSASRIILADTEAETPRRENLNDQYSNALSALTRKRQWLPDLPDDPLENAKARTIAAYCEVTVSKSLDLVTSLVESSLFIRIENIAEVDIVIEALHVRSSVGSNPSELPAILSPGDQLCLLIKLHQDLLLSQQGKPSWNIPDPATEGSAGKVFPLCVKWRVATRTYPSVWAQFGANCPVKRSTPIQVSVQRESASGGSRNVVTVSVVISNFDSRPVNLTLKIPGSEMEGDKSDDDCCHLISLSMEKAVGEIEPGKSKITSLQFLSLRNKVVEKLPMLHLVDSLEEREFLVDGPYIYV